MVRHTLKIFTKCCKIFEVCLIILGHYALKGYIMSMDDSFTRRIYQISLSLLNPFLKNLPRQLRQLNVKLNFNLINKKV